MIDVGKLTPEETKELLTACLVNMTADDILDAFKAWSAQDPEWAETFEVLTDALAE